MKKVLIVLFILSLILVPAVKAAWGRLQMLDENVYQGDIGVTIVHDKLEKVNCYLAYNTSRYQAPAIDCLKAEK